MEKSQKDLQRQTYLEKTAASWHSRKSVQVIFISIRPIHTLHWFLVLLASFFAVVVVPNFKCCLRMYEFDSVASCVSSVLELKVCLLFAVLDR